MSVASLSFVEGWSVGYRFVQAKAKEDEIKQGKNYYMASLCQASQLISLSAVVDKIATLGLQNGKLLAARIATNVVPFLGIPALLFAACVKHGHYEHFAQFYNASPRLPGHVPDTLSERTIKVLSFIAEHAGDILRVAMVASCVALIAMGSYLYTAAIAVAVTYQTIDQLGYVPRKVSLFMERYMPIVATVGMMMGGALVTQVFAAGLFLTQVAPASVGRFVHHKIDILAHKYLNYTHPTLQDCDAPLVTKKELSFNEITKIINGSDYQYEINPAHCSKSMLDMYDYEENRKYAEFLPFFDKVDWTKKYEILKSRALDDDRFIDFLKGYFPDLSPPEKRDNTPEGQAKRAEFVKKVESYIEELSARKNISKEEFLASWLREQMVSLIDYLEGRRRVKGLQRDLDDTMNNCAKILPYLQKLDLQVKDEKIEFEDSIVKLAFEGGDYCARGMKRASNEVVENVALKGASVSLDPVEQYEMKLYQKLQQARDVIIQREFQRICVGIHLPDAVTAETHGFDIYRMLLSVGFYPVTENERNNEMGLDELFSWEMYGTLFRNTMYEDYQNGLEAVVEEMGEANMGIYLANIINANKKLSEAQKTQLIDMYTERNDERWTTEVTKTKFRRLAFVMLGILRPKA